MWKRLTAGKPDDPGGSADLDALARAMAEGDESALGRFYDITVGRAYAFALRIVRDPRLAEEVTEDAYFQLWREASRFDPARGNALAWLYTVCRSRALDALRRRETNEIYEDPAELEHMAGSDGHNDPYQLLDAVQRSTALHGALSSLSPQARQLVALSFFRGLSHSEIAVTCQLPLGTVKTTINRACDKMRDYLATAAGVTS